MAGKKRFSAKFVVLTGVLSMGAAGVYYFTSGGGAPWSWLHRGKVDSATPSTANDENRVAKARSASELDAVASAWAADSSQNHSNASPEARSADATLANSQEAAAPRASRYDRYSDTALAAAATVAAATVEPTAPAEAAAPSDSLEPAATPDLSSTSPAPETASIARGQDPGAAGTVAADQPASVATSGGASDAAADALRLADESATASSSASAARARQAFNDEPPPTTSDRYRTAAEPRRGGDSSSAKSNSMINPFALQPNQNSAAMSPATSAASAPPGPAAQPSFTGGPAETPIDGATGYERAIEKPRTLPAEPSDAASGYDTARTRSQIGMGSPLSGALSTISGNDSNGAEGTGRPGERALEGAQNPALVIQKSAPPEIQVGKPAKFVIQVRNVGGQAAAEVIIRDEVPQGTRLLSTSPAAEVSGGQLLWRFGTLSIGEERVIEVQLMPTAEGDIGSVATVTYSAQASIKTRSTMPQLAIRMTAPKQVMIGQEQRVKIELHNPGSGDATGVMLFENVPENVRHAAGPALEFEIGTLRAGETRELELILHAEKPGKVTNVLSARAEGNLEVQQQVEFEVIAPALDIEVNGPERRYLERPATYEVRVENPGTAPARDIQLITKLPKGMKFIRANNMGEYDAGTHAVYWSLSELPEGEHGTVELVAMPIEAGAQTLQVEGRAQQGLSDETKQQILVEGLAAIMFEVRDLEDPIEVGRETGYEIRVVNQGTKAATNVQIALALPQGMQLVTAEGETRHSTSPGGIVFAPIRELAPKADTVYRVKVQCLRAGDQRVTVDVKTDDLAQPIRREESTRVFGDD